MTPPATPPITNVARAVGSPLHHQISVVLRSAIASGRYSPGDYLPGEISLMDMFDVSRATVRRALSTLEAEQLVDRRAGKGTRVLASTLAMPIDAHLRLLESRAARTTVQVLEFETVVTPREATRALTLPDGTRTLKIVRLRLRNGVPVRLLTNYVPVDIGSRLRRGDIKSGTLVGALQRQGNTVTRAEDEVGATLADPLTAPLLQVRVGDPLLEMSRTVYDSAARPLAFQWTLVSPDRFRVRLQISGAEERPVAAIGDYVAFAPVGAPPDPPA